MELRLLTEGVEGGAAFHNWRMLQPVITGLLFNLAPNSFGSEVMLFYD